MPMAIPTIKTTQPYSVFNKNEEGCSSFFRLMYDTNGKTRPLIYPYNREDLRENSVLFIISPDVEFTEEEVENLKDYLSSGNVLIIADNFNSGNGILKYMNLSYRFSKKPLYDVIKPVEFYNNGYIILENPSIIVGKGSGNVVMYSSDSSNMGNYPRPRDESRYPIILEENYGGGKIILISDPTLFKNKLFNYNKEFLKDYFNYSDKNTIYFDEYHHSDVNPQNIVTVTVNNSNITPEFISYLFTIVLIIMVVSKGIGVLFKNLIKKFENVIIGNNNSKQDTNSHTKIFIEDIIKKYNLNKSLLYRIINKII